jgi:integrase
MDGKRFELSTGVFVSKADWDENAQILSGRSEKVRIINNRLEKFVSRIFDLYNQLEAKGENFDISHLKDKLIGIKPKNGLLDVFNKVIISIEAKLDKGYSLGTIKHYKSTYQKLKEFIPKYYKQSDIPIDKVDYEFLNSFDSFLKSNFNISANTAWGYHRQLKKVLGDAVAMNLLVKHPYSIYRVKRVEANRDFLTLEELRKLENKNISLKRLELVRDIFVFACYTGLSYSDIGKLSKDHLQIGNDSEEWIIIDRSKNDSRCRIPLLPKAKSILEKYENYPINNAMNLLLPVHSNQKMNAYLKELADICNINKNLSMHVARHTFATSVTLSNGVPIETVSKMLGHNSLKTTQIYARIVDTKISEDMKKLKLKLVV